MDNTVHPAINTFLLLLIAHLVADFPLQNDWIANNKGKRLSASAAHIGIHYVIAWGLLHFFANLAFLSCFNQSIVLIYVAAHFAVDTGNGLITAGKPSRGRTTFFILDQSVHVLTAAATAAVLAKGRLRDLESWHVEITAKTQFHILVTATVYLAVIFAGGHLIRHITRTLSPNVEGDDGGEPPEQLKNAGMYLGWLERFLVITAIAIHSPALVGLILTGKSIARYPELKNESFAEYFLIGTMLSLSIAFIGGLLLALMYYGTFALN